MNKNCTCIHKETEDWRSGKIRSWLRSELQLQNGSSAPARAPQLKTGAELQNVLRAEEHRSNLNMFWSNNLSNLERMHTHYVIFQNCDVTLRAGCLETDGYVLVYWVHCFEPSAW